MDSFFSSHDALGLYLTSFQRDDTDALSVGDEDANPQHELGNGALLD